MVTICRMVATPRPSSPIRQPIASSYSISAEALDRLPSLSFNRTSRRPFRRPSGSTRGIRQQVSPPGACARVRKTSFIGAEVNHLCPSSRYSPAADPDPPIGVAVVVFARTSDPPCFSVIDIPASRPSFDRAGRSPKS